MKKENVLGFALNANDMIRSPDCGIGHIRDINATPFGRRLRGCKATPVVMKSQHNQLPAADFPYVETHRFLALCILGEEEFSVGQNAFIFSGVS